MAGDRIDRSKIRFGFVGFTYLVSCVSQQWDKLLDCKGKWFGAVWESPRKDNEKG